MFEPHSSVRFIFLNSDKRSPRAGIGREKGKNVEVREKVASRDSSVPFFFLFLLTPKNRPWPREFKKDASLASRAMLYY